MGNIEVNARAKTAKKETRKESPAVVSKLSLMKQRDKLENLINQTLARHDYEAASLIMDQYLKKFEDDMSYDQLCVIANTLSLLERNEQAFKLTMRALRMNSDNPGAPEILFWIYLNRGDKQALTVIDRLIEDGPAERRQSYLYWKVLYANNTKDSEMLFSCIEVAGGLPSLDFDKYHHVVFSYIVALCESGRADEAEPVLEGIPREIFFNTQYLPMAEAHLKKTLGQYGEAVSIYEEMLKRHPGIPEATWNKSLAHLSLGQLEQGWVDHEARWDWAGYPSPKRLFDTPKWEGQPLENRSILIWAEQGLGDQIMFLTLALPIIRNPLTRVVIEVSEKLVELFTVWYPEAEVRPFGDIDVRGNANYSEFDYQVPSASLMKHFLPDIESVRSRPIRFLGHDAQLKKEVLEKTSELPLVGICWRSSVVTKDRSSHYLNVHAVEKIAREMKGLANVVCLQYAMDSDEREILGSIDNVYISEADFYDDILTHTRHIGICDYVITPPTVVSQIAGICNKNTLTWGLKSWVFLGQRQYPWYPNHATLELSDNYSVSSLVYGVSKWIRSALLHLDHT
ncbi:hypothetical protein N8Y93_02650 [Litorivicinus sp.]|nr:hypothetical protein [Litorivicinus sp.]